MQNGSVRQLKVKLFYVIIFRFIETFFNISDHISFFEVVNRGGLVVSRKCDRVSEVVFYIIKQEIIDRIPTQIQGLDVFLERESIVNGHCHGLTGSGIQNKTALIA